MTNGLLIMLKLYEEQSGFSNDNNNKNKNNNGSTSNTNSMREGAAAN